MWGRLLGYRTKYRAEEVKGAFSCSLSYIKIFLYFSYFLFLIALSFF